MLKVEQPLALVCIFTWLGFVCGISFLEAWLKFRAPGVTLPIGLSIGKLVFKALNRIEWIFAAAVLISTVWNKTQFLSFQFFNLVILLSILVLQTAWLLPQLDARAELYIKGDKAAPSNLHFYFIAGESLKVIGLIVYGTRLFKQ